MRRFTLLTIALCASFVGCKPATETLPKVAPKPASSATTVDPVAESQAAAEVPAEAAVAPAADAPAAGAPAAESPAADSPATESPATESPAASGASKASGAAVRFVADKKLEVPAMMCPYGCYPSVRKTLASLPGVKDVQLAEQPAGTKEGEIALRVVELKLEEGFDVNAAIAALKKAEFPATEVN